MHNYFIADSTVRNIRMGREEIKLILWGDLSLPTVHMGPHILMLFILLSHSFHVHIHTGVLQEKLYAKGFSSPVCSAVLYYTSCWDFVGIKIEIVGMDPKPRPTTPRDFVDSALFLDQKEN